MILCNAGVAYILEHGCYISALEYVRMLILSTYVLLASINTTDKLSRFGDLASCMLSFNFGVKGSISQA